MPYDPNKHHRRSIRLAGYDYRQPGYYFVTVCTYRHQALFGHVIEDQMQLSVYGRIVDTIWRRLLDRADGVTLDAWVVMPNHVHAIIVLTGDAGSSGRGEAWSVTSGPSEMKVGGESQRSESDSTHHASPLQQGDPQRPTMPRLVPGSLGAIVGNVKSVITRRINKVRKTPGTPVWQRNYYEHIIRDETSMARIRTYIADNPCLWTADCYYAEGPSSFREN